MLVIRLVNGNYKLGTSKYISYRYTNKSGNDAYFPSAGIIFPRSPFCAKRRAKRGKMCQRGLLICPIFAVGLLDWMFTSGAVVPETALTILFGRRSTVRYWRRCFLFSVLRAGVRLVTFRKSAEPLCFFDIIFSFIEGHLAGKKEHMPCQTKNRFVCRLVSGILRSHWMQ